MDQDDILDKLCLLEKIFMKQRILPLKTIAKILGVKESMAEYLVKELERIGVVEEVEPVEEGICACSRCPFARICPYSLLPRKNIGALIGKLYRYRGLRTICLQRDSIELNQAPGEL